MNRPRPRRPRLRTQLVALLVGLLLGAFVVTALITTAQLHGFLLDRLDQQLRAAGVRFSVSLEHPGDHDADDGQFAAVTGQATGTLGARVAAGRVTAAAVIGREDKRSATDPGARARAILAAAPPDGRPQTVDLPGLGDYRILAVRGDDGDTLITGLPLRPVQDTIERLVTIEAVVLGVALLLVAGITALSVRLALRPLNRVADTAARVADLPLSSGTVALAERAPQPDSHTEAGTVAAAFNHMLEHVEASLHSRHASEERLRSFLADASHELRTPVAVIRSHAEYARRTGDHLPPEVADALRRIDAESQRMGHLVDDLLLLARLDSGRPLTLTEVDLSRLAVDAVSDARAAGPQHTWRLQLPEQPVTVHGDEHTLHQVLANLLANARTHTPAGTTVLTAVHDHGPSGVELTVTDDGPGIPPDLQHAIFERFVRAEQNRAADTGSSGLGLAIVHAIVHAHHGQITVTSQPGQTRFTVLLPPAPP
ncbi:MAG TPA: HAMP domain-containing sensor histidine kinase [Jatrophihabitans sp.]|nr:HAMP domain-containing sensor histidine kinase [Jatrophihabitans sp.]